MLQPPMQALDERLIPPSMPVQEEGSTSGRDSGDTGEILCKQHASLTSKQPA